MAKNKVYWVGKMALRGVRDIMDSDEVIEACNAPSGVTDSRKYLISTNKADYILIPDECDIKDFNFLLNELLEK